LAVGSWRLAVGSWQLAVGGWRLAVGGWQLAVEVIVDRGMAIDDPAKKINNKLSKKYFIKKVSIF
jgi:hypothetical protein